MSAASGRFPGLFPIRYTVLVLCAVGTITGLGAALAWGGWWWLLPLVLGALSAVGVQDLRQTRHAVLRNYPVIGHMRFMLEFIRPEIRQYFIEGDHENLPFRARSARWCTSAARACPTAAPLARCWM